MLLNKNVHKQVSTFKTTLMNIFSNYIPNKCVTVDNKDPPTVDNKVLIYQDQKISLDYKI